MKFAKYLQHLRYQESLDAQSAPDFDLALNTNPLQRRQFLGALVAAAGMVGFYGLAPLAQGATHSNKPHLYCIYCHYDYASPLAPIVPALASFVAPMFPRDKP